jgi:hypothetical protein
MAPKAKQKAEPKPEPKAPAAPAPGAAQAKLLEELDKALSGVVNDGKKAEKAVAKLLDRTPCSLTHRAAVFLRLLLAEQPQIAANQAKHLQQAVAAAKAGVAAYPECTHARVALVHAHVKNAQALSAQAEGAAGAAFRQKDEAACEEWAQVRAALDALPDELDSAPMSADVLGAERTLIGGAVENGRSVGTLESYRNELLGKLLRRAYAPRRTALHRTAAR